MKSLLIKALRRLLAWLEPQTPPPTIQGGGPGDTPPPPRVDD